MVIWLMGISGSGKSTLGKMIKDKLDKAGKHSYILDGDEVRQFYDNDLGYEKKDRVENIKRIMLSAHTLSKSGTFAIVCNIHPFKELREFARRKIDNYNEVYLRRHIDNCRNNDVKSMYRENHGKTQIVGIDLKFDEPDNSDLVIDTDNESAEQSFEKIVGFLNNKYPGEIL